MSDFYSIKYPSLELKHGAAYLCVDDWDNVFLAEYDASQDMFFINFDSDHIEQRINFIFDSDQDAYVASEAALRFQPHQATEGYNPLRENRIEKLIEFNLDIRGVKS